MAKKQRPAWEQWAEILRRHSCYEDEELTPAEVRRFSARMSRLERSSTRSPRATKQALETASMILSQLIGEIARVHLKQKEVADDLRADAEEYAARLEDR